MDVGALAGASGRSSVLEGRVESVEDGVAKIRLRAGTLLEVAVDRPLPEGTAVLVGVAPDGSTSLALRGPTPDLVALRSEIESTLLSLVGPDLAGKLSAPLARGDLAAAAKILPSASASAGPTAGEGPVFLSAAANPPAPEGETWLAVVGRIGENLYAAESAGRSWTLHGPADLESPARLLSGAKPLPGGAAVWIPSSVESWDPPEVAGLASRIAAGPEGAAQLLRWAGVSDPTPEEVAGLGRALSAAARTLLDREPVQDAVRTSPDSPAPTPATAPSGEASDGPSRGDSIPPPSVAASLPGPLTESVQVAPPPGPATVAPSGLRTREADPPAPPIPATVAPAASDEVAAGRLPSGVAVRVLVAWAAELPDSPAVRRAVADAAPSVPQALEQLEQAVRKAPGRHPALESVLARVRDSGLPAVTGDPGIRRELEAAVVESLRRERSDPQGDPAPFGRAAESLLADRLPDASDPTGAARSHWTAGRDGTRKVRIVVRDERGSRRGASSDPGVHAVEISMSPPGLGEVGARLELRGRVLNTRLDAADPDTAERIRARLPELSAAFQRIGLEPGGLVVRETRAAAADQPSRRREAGGRLDVRA